MSEVIDPAVPVAAPVAAPAEPAAPAAPAPSLMARGSAAAPAPAAPAPEAPPAIAEKFIVKGPDGQTDWQASALKQAQSYSHLEKRLGAGEAPPAKPEDYAPTLPEGLSMDALKGDPKFAGFLKGAHSRGVNNAQLSWIMQEYAQRLTPDPAMAEAELRKVWADDATLTQNLGLSHRATKAFGGDLFETLEKKFGNDPDFIRFTAAIGKELGEDKGAPPDFTQGDQDTLESLMASPAYFDAKHPQHAQVVAKAAQLYAKKYPNA